MNDSASAGPAWLAAAVPVRTKIPVPMIPPIPRRVSAVAESVRCSCCPFASASLISAIDLVAKSWLGMRADSTQATAAKPASLFRAQHLRNVRRKEIEQRCVHFGRTGEDVPPQGVLGARECADPAARLLDEEGSGRGVPGREPDLPETVDPAGRDISEVERGGTGAAHTGGTLHGRFEHLEIRIDVARVRAEREARADESTLQRALLADPNAMVLEVRAAAAGRGEELLAHGIVDHRDLEPALLLAGDRDGESRKAMQEVGGAVERIDDPDAVVLAAAAALLREHGVVRIVVADDADDLLLGVAIDFADEVVAPFGSDGERLQPVEAADDDFAGAARGTDGDIEKGVHGSSRKGRGPCGRR